MRQMRSSIMAAVLLTVGIGLVVQAQQQQVCERECLVWGKRDPDTGEAKCLRYATCPDEKEKECIRYCKDEKGERFCCEYKKSGMSDDALVPAILPTDGPSCEAEQVSTKAACLALLTAERCPGNCDNCGASKYTDCCLTESVKGGKSWVLCGKVECTCPSACNKP